MLSKINSTHWYHLQIQLKYFYVLQIKKEQKYLLSNIWRFSKCYKIKYLGLHLTDAICG